MRRLMQADETAGTPAGPGGADTPPGGPDEQIGVRGVTLQYWSRDRTFVEALSRVDLSIRGGEFIALLGPSGCGKSSLLRVLCGLTKPTSGEIAFRGSAGNASGRAARGAGVGARSVGLVPQAATLLPWLKVLDNVLLPAKILGLPRAEAETRARELLEMTGLAGFEDRYPRQLSGGMQQRVSIARALIHDPQVLLMDEPFAALDALNRERLSAELQSIWLATGKTVVFVTHSISEAVFLADRIVVMSRRPGRIISEFPVTEARPRSLDRTSPESEELSATIRGVLEGDAGSEVERI